MTMRLTYTLLTAIALFVAGVLASYLYLGQDSFFQTLHQLQNPKALFQERRSTYENLTRTNQDFTAGMRALNSGNPEQARAHFENALQLTTDELERLQIAYKIAVAKRDSGDYITAIRELKDLAAHPSSNQFMRAYAVENMAQMYYTYPQKAKEITTEIFSSSPYDAMYVEGNLEQSYVNVFRYAATFYETGYGALRIANHTLNEWGLREENGSITAQERQVYRDEIVHALTSADADIERIKDVPNQKDGIPEIMMRRAVVIAKLQKLAPDAVAPFGDLDSAFQSAFTIYSLRARESSDGYLRFNYAYMLWHNFGDSRQADIRSILKPLYQNPDYQNENVTQFFRSESDNRLGVRHVLVALATLDPDFKAHLISLGWSPSLLINAPWHHDALTIWYTP